jgi:protein-S-isoprenylcysteine O-methyltransferase Ste14
MTDESTYRWMVVAAFVIMLFVALPYRIRSQKTGEPLDRRQEGLFILATLRPVAVVLWLSVITYMVNPARMAWSSVVLAAPVRWLGVAIWALAIALLIWTLRSLGPNLTDTVVTRRAHTLVTRGPYRWVRHPFYDSMALLILAISVLAANWFFLVCGIIVFSLLVVRTRTEERHLVARFGSSYQTYMTQTGRFLPRPGAGRLTPP